MRNCWHDSASIDRWILPRARETCSRRQGSISGAKRRRKSRSQLSPRWRRYCPIEWAVSFVNVGVTLTQSQQLQAARRRSDLMSMAAVVLAAGGSTRFGKPKQFALFQGETFIKRIVAAAIEAGCAPVVVVTGEDSAQVTLELTGRTVSIAMNPRWSSGLGSSIGVGVQRAMDLAADLDASLLLTCDQPIVASAYAGTLGIPALFDRSCFPDLLQLKGDSGAKGIILERQHDVASFDFPPGEIDIDTAADYEKLDQPLPKTAPG